jgi:hypothetical protein
MTASIWEPGASLVGSPSTAILGDLVIAEAAQTFFPFTTITAIAGTKSVLVQIDGIWLPFSAYTVSATGVNVNTPQQVGAQVQMVGFRIALVGSLTENVSYQAAGTGAVARSQESVNFDSVSVKDFGAAGDGVTDDTAAIILAIAYAATFASGYGLAIFFPRGDYLYSTINIGASNVKLRANGDARFIKSGATGDGLTIVGSGSRIYGVSVRGFVFTNNVTATAGRQIYVENAGQVSLDEIVISSYPAAPFKGVELYNVSQITVDAEVQNCLDKGFFASDCVDVTLIPGSRADANASHGWSFDTCSGVYATNVTAYGNGGKAFHVASTIGSPVLATAGNSFHFYTGCIGDTSGEDNWHLSGLIHSKLSLCWGSTQGNTTADLSGFVVSGCTDIELSGCVALTNNAAGLHVTGASTGIKIIGGDYNNNGQQAGSARREGIVLDNGTVVQMSGTTATDTQSTKTQQYGLRARPTVTTLIMSACNLEGNAVYPFAFDAVPVNFKESSNFTALPASVASASSLVVPTFSDVLTVTGTTNITGIANQWRDRRLTLIFEDVLTVVDGASLNLAGDFVTTAGDTLTLVSDGAAWYEVSRSAN